MTSPTPQLGRAELEILQYVADHHPIRVGEVAEHFAATAGKARTTVLTVMERLRNKGYLRRKKIAGTWHYSPKTPKSTLLRTLVERFIDESLEGSLSPFMAYLSESNSLTDEEFDQLKQLVHDLESSREGKKP
jgi:predicted transcriptional regulator